MKYKSSSRLCLCLRNSGSYFRIYSPPSFQYADHYFAGLVYDYFRFAVVARANWLFQANIKKIKNKILIGPFTLLA